MHRVSAPIEDPLYLNLCEYARAHNTTAGAVVAACVRLVLESEVKDSNEMRLPSTPKRGRPLGSKNKPKAVAAGAEAPAANDDCHVPTDEEIDGADYGDGVSNG